MKTKPANMTVYLGLLQRWPVGVTGHVFVHTLNSYLQPGAAVAQHVAEVPLQAVVGPRLDGDAHALGVAALRVPAAGRWRRHHLLAPSPRLTTAASI